VIPPVVARLLTDSFHRMMWLSIAIGVISGFFGVYLSYYLNWSSGASVVIVASILFVVAWIVSPLRASRAPSLAGIETH
jgi:ABC-type Mn2+/Zn2+ transport system permease subunit